MTPLVNILVIYDLSSRAAGIAATAASISAETGLCEAVAFTEQGRRERKKSADKIIGKQKNGAGTQKREPGSSIWAEDCKDAHSSVRFVRSGRKKRIVSKFKSGSCLMMRAIHPIRRAVSTADSMSFYSYAIESMRQHAVMKPDYAALTAAVSMPTA